MPGGGVGSHGRGIPGVSGGGVVSTDDQIAAGSPEREAGTVIKNTGEREKEGEAVSTGALRKSLIATFWGLIGRKHKETK